MFDDLNEWTWIAVAWLELVIAYGGYLLYLRSRSKRLEDED
ncbi:MAG TPA: hypothetical protein VF168_13820 [Trueperaceae bacterium]